MRNDRGVYWQVETYTLDGYHAATLTFDNAEAARKAIRNMDLPSNAVKLFKIDPDHGPVELMP